MAVIEFNLDGVILDANANFLRVVGYSLAELVGQHHRMLCQPGYVNSPEYQQLWQRLRHGDFVSGKFRRVGKGGRTIWLEASYNPIRDETGQVVRVSNLPRMSPPSPRKNTNTRTRSRRRTGRWR